MQRGHRAAREGGRARVVLELARAHRPARQRGPVAVERPDAPVGAGRDHLKDAVPVEIGEHGAALGAGAERDRPDGQAGRVEVEEEG
ncbi:MAG: hypothetical protein ACK559_38040, partial [bacterium]